jgi:hypothetical protein
MKLSEYLKRTGMTTEEYFAKKKRESEGRKTLGDVQREERASFISRLENLDKLSAEAKSVYDAYKSRYFDENGNYKNTYLGDTDDAYNTFNAFKSKFDTESQEILDSFDKYSHLFSKDYVNSTKDWLTSWGESLNNMRSAYLGERYRYDSQKGQKELEEKEKLYETLKPYKEIFDYGSPDIGDDHLYDELGLKTGSSKETYEWNRAIAKKKLKELGFTPEDVDKLYSELGERKKYHRDAVRLQTEANFDNVGNSESDVYDPNFDAYVKKGNSIGFSGVGSQSKRIRGAGGKSRGRLVITPDSEKAAAIALYEHNGGTLPSNSKYNQGAIDPYRNFNDDEFKALAYWIGYDEANGTNKTAEYLAAKENTLNARMGQDIYDKIEDSVALELAFGVVAGLDQFASGLENVFNAEDDYISPSAIQYASGMVREDLENTGGAHVAYDLITTTANMAPSILASAAVGTVSKTAGAALGASLIGTSAAGNAYQDMLNAGYDKSQARTYSTLVGVSEAGLQYALGGIGKLGSGAVGKFTSKTLGGIAKGINDANIQFAIQYGGQYVGNMISEGFEEGLQEVLDPFFRSIATGEKPEGVDWEQVAYSGMLGALSAGVLEGGGSIATRVSEIGKARTIKNEGNVETLKNVGKTFSADSVAYKIADKVTEKTGAYKLSMLLHDVNANLSEQNVQDIENALVEKGLAREDAESIAKWLGKAVDGGKLNKAQQMALDENPIISQVFREVIVDKNSTVNQRLQGIMELSGLKRQVGVDLDALKESSTNKEAISDKINVKNVYNDHLKRMADATAREQSGLISVADIGTETMLDSLINDVKGKADAIKIENAIAKAYQSKTPIENAIREGNKVSEENGVAVKKITKIGNDGKMMVETDNGAVEDADDIQFKSYDDGYIILATSDMATELNGLGIDLDVTSANAVVNGYSPNSDISAMDYMLGAKAAIRYGVIGQKRNTITKDSPYHNLTKSQQDYLYKIGRDIAENTTNKEESKVKARETSTSKKSKNGKVTKAIRSKLKPNQATAISTVEKLSEVGILKNNFYFFESVKGRVLIDGKYQNAMVFATDVGGYKKGEYAPNGFYQDANGDIYIDINSGASGEGFTFYTLAHELGHFVKHENPTGFKVLADFIASELGGNFESLIQDKLDLWKKLGRTEFGYMDAYEDVICDALEPMFTDGNLAERLVEKSKASVEGKGLLKTLKKFFSDLYKRIQQAYAKLPPQDPAAVEMKKHQKSIGKVADLFAEAIVGANENFDNADIQAQKNTTEDGGVKNSLRAFEDGRRFVDVNVDQAQFDGLSITEMNALAKKIIKSKYAGKVVGIDNKVFVNGKSSEKYVHFPHGTDEAIIESKARASTELDNLIDAGTNFRREEDGRDGHTHPDVVDGFNYFDTIFKVAGQYYSGTINIKNIKNGKLFHGVTKVKNITQDIHDSYGENPTVIFLRDVSMNSIDNPAEKVKENFGKDSKQAETTLEENGIVVDSKTKSASLSVRYLLEDVQKSKVAKSLAERFDVTEKEALNWLTAETSLSSLILNPKYSQYLDYEADPDEVAIKQNSDYPQGTVDFSPICAKRREFTSVMNNILRLFPSHVFAATDLAKIRTIMQEEGMTIPCGICYVEDRRQLDTIVAQDFIDGLKLYREGSKTRPDGKPFNANQLKGLQLTDGDTYIPSIYELVSLEGRNKLKAKNPNMEAAWVKYNNARGMQAVRLLANEAEYKRQILDYSKSTVKAKNDKGGLRIYSFSDAEMFHLIDIIQVITDSSAVGLCLQGYTKVNEYAKAVKDTGEKLNRSLIPKGELGYHMENGKVVLDYDTVEGIDINSKDFFDNRDNPNVGNITIGVSDVQIRAAMVSDFVDQIIPFHTGQSAEVLGEKGIATWTNYKDFQAEKDISTGKKSEHQINIYTEVLQVLEKEGTPITKRSFVEKFLQVCKENELTPRFAQFLNTNENGEYVYTEGYHKMLVDFKTFAQTEIGEYLPQMPVKPIFDNEYITNLLKDYVETQKVKDAAIAESMPKVIERITNEIINPGEQSKGTSTTKYSDRDYIESESKILDLEEQISQIEEELADDIFDEIPADERKKMNNQLWKLRHELEKLEDIERKASRKTSLAEIRDNLDKYRYIDLRSLAEGVGWEDYEDMSKSQLANAMREYLNDVEEEWREDESSNFYSAQDGMWVRPIEDGASDKGNVIQFPGSKFSDRDTLGNVLSKGQQEFFKDSKVRDENGNLMVVYHGTPNGNFNTFRISEGAHSSLMAQYGAGYYFDANKDSAKRYTQNVNKTSIRQSPKVFEVYLNIKNPLVIHDEYLNGRRPVITKQQFNEVVTKGNYEWMFTNGMPFELTKHLGKSKTEIQHLPREEIIKHWVDMVYDRAYFDSEILSAMVKAYQGDSILDVMKDVFGNDGVKVVDKYGEMWVAWDNSQIKEIANTNPTTDPDIRFSDRDYRLNSRNLLANALESSVTNPTEREWLNKYKAQIDSLNEDQRRLDEINAEIKRISFTKGSDRSKLTALNNNKKTLTARITRADKKLLDFEASKPLKNVLEAEKKRVVQRARDEARENLKAEKEKSAQNIRELMNRYTERIERNKEGRDKTAVRKKIRNVVSYLNSIFNRGTKERNVKLGLQDTVSRALATAEVLFFDEITNADIVRLGVESVTDKEMKYLEEYNNLLNQLDSAKEEDIPSIKAKISRLNSMLKNVFIREKARLNRQTVDYALTSLAEAYKELKNSPDEYIKNNSFVEGMYERIIGLKDDLKGVTIKDMSLEQLESVYKIYSMVKHMVTNANSIFRQGKAEDLATNISNVQAEIDAIPSNEKDSPDIIEKMKDPIRSFTWNELKPYYAFDRLGSKTFEKLYWDVVEADGVWAKDMEEAANLIEESRKKHGYKKWDMKTARTFKSSNGLDFKLTLGDMMSIYAYSKRPQAQDHMTIGGFVFDQGSAYKDNGGKKKGLFKTFRHAKLSETYRVDPKLIGDVIAELEKIEGAKEYVDEMQSYLTQLGEKGNEVSRIMFGIDLFKEKVYFPLQSAKDYRSSIEQTLNATQTMASLKNTGISKETVPHANNPIVLRNFDDVVLEHINTMSKYHAYVIPIENLSKVFNNVGRDTINGDYISTQALISSKFGNSATKYFDQFITDLNGGSFGGGASNPLAKLFGTSKAVSVAANLSVVAQQYFAVIRAMDEIAPKYMTPFLNSEASKSTEKQWSELKKYAPIGIIKEIGGFDMGANRSAIDYIGDAETQMDAKKVGKKVKEGTMWLAGKMDEIGWSTIWRAVKKEIADTTSLDIGTEEFFQACGKRFTEVVAKTQVYDSITSRSGYMRSKHESVKYLTSFMGEPTTIVNMMFSKQLKLARAIKSKDKAAIKEASLGLLRTSSVVILSTVLTSLAKSLPYAMRDDEEEEGALLERWAKHFGEATASDMNPLGMIPIGRDLVSIWEGWDIERPDMTLISDIFTAFRRAVKDGCDTDEALALAGALANILGYPLKNIIRDVKGFIRLFGDITDDIAPEDIGGAFAEGFTD